jgi:hypothetical protein
LKNALNVNSCTGMKINGDGKENGVVVVVVVVVVVD